MMARPFSAAAGQGVPAVPPGHLIYAVGDIHGRADLLDQLFRQIRDDASDFEAERRTVIFLGDYIDRGADSRRVVDLALQGVDGFDAVYLKGNHEQLLLDFVEHGTGLALWLANGADTTLASYGLDVEALAMSGAGPGVWRAAFLAALPAAHLRFFESLDVTAAFGDYLFVHAGVRPRVPLDRQRDEDRIWIREEFLSSDEDFGKIVVHGHTPGEAPVVRRNRIGIDTLAWASGRLTALRLWGSERAFLSTTMSVSLSPGGRGSG